MRRLRALSWVALALGLLPALATVAGLGIWGIAACVDPPFAQPATGLCGIAETLRAALWWVPLGLLVALVGGMGLLAHAFSNFRPR